MQEVRAASFHLHKARIMSASLQLPDHFEVHSECPFAGVGSNVRIRIGSGFNQGSVGIRIQIQVGKMTR
jgi:hypothetical protein